MSALFSTRPPVPEAPESRHDDDAAVAGTPVTVRRRAGLAALIGAAGSAVAIAYLWRAAQTLSPLDWAVCALMAAIAGVYLSALLDARTPVLVADDLGVRIRLGGEWRGLPWDAVDRLEIHPGRNRLRDGRLVVLPTSLARVVEGLDAKGRRQVRTNQKLYGAPLAVPLGLTSRLSTGDGRSVVEAVEALAPGRVRVAEAEPDAQEPGPRQHVPTGTRLVLLGGIGTIVSRVGKGRRNDVDGGEREHEGGAEDPLAGSAEPAAHVAQPDEETGAPARHPVPLRAPRPGMRAEVTRSVQATTGQASQATGVAAEGPARRTEGRGLRRPGMVDLVFDAVSPRVRPISQLGDPVEPLVIDDYAAEPAYDPVIGPELAAARTRLGLSVDELAERTRIRPHVIEAVEVDDFAPCGGDFYARGHLRTLARVLGKDPAPLLEQFEQRYATAPVSPRRVFEAELATGMTGSMRSTVGGASWGLLIGVVLSLVLVWGVARLVAGEPSETVRTPAPLLNGSGGLEVRYPSPERLSRNRPVRLTLATRSERNTRVVVRDGDGQIVYSGMMASGDRRRIRAVPPVRVRAQDAGAVTVLERRHGKVRDRSRLGKPGEPGRRTFR